MNNYLLREIIEEIKKDEQVDLKDIAVKINADRSYLSKLINSKEVKEVTEALLLKFKRHYPAYFSKNNINNVLDQKNPFPEGEFLEERAMIRVLAREVAELRARIDGGNADDITKEYVKRAKAVLDALKAF